MTMKIAAYWTHANLRTSDGPGEYLRKALQMVDYQLIAIAQDISTK